METPKSLHFSGYAPEIISLAFWTRQPPILSINLSMKFI